MVNKETSSTSSSSSSPSSPESSFTNYNNTVENDIINDADLMTAIQKDFLITQKKIYLNNGSIAPVPISTIKAVTDFYLRYSEHGPDSTIFNEYLDELKNEARKRVADLINCSPDEVIFTQSTTEGINFIANGIAWNQNDRILLRSSINEHHSNYLPWIKVANDNNLIIDHFPKTNENFVQDFREIFESKSTTKMVTTSHVMYNDGSITPVEKMGNIIKKNGNDNNTNNNDGDSKIFFSIDAAQSAGAIPIDVRKIKCDFLSFPAFKWICGPLGVGILYANKKSMDEIEPIFVGSGTAKIQEGSEKSDKNIEKIKFYEYPEKYHATFRNYPGLAGLESSLRYLLRIGISNIYQKNRNLAKIFRDEIINVKDIVVHEAIEEDMRSSMVCFSFVNNNDIKTKTIVEKLQENGIILVEREIGSRKIIRASPHFYNSEEEILKTANEIKYLNSRI